MSAFRRSLRWAGARAPVRSGAYESAWATRGKGAGKAGGLLGWLPLAGSLCIAIGYAVIVTYILKALVDSLVGTLMTADTAAWFGEFSSTSYSVVPYHIIVVAGTLLTLYSRRAQHRKDKQDHDAAVFPHLLRACGARRVPAGRMRRAISSCSLRAGRR